MKTYEIEATQCARTKEIIDHLRVKPHLFLLKNKQKYLVFFLNEFHHNCILFVHMCFHLCPFESNRERQWLVTTLHATNAACVGDLYCSVHAQGNCAGGLP